ncbi:MAG: nucleoid-associated protein [Tissierellales bacterium]|jgi:hypothetical protein|nr:nucleoid-associated protein [Tissierellales bacterium]
MDDKIKIDRGILHILDIENGMPIFSDNFLEDDEASLDFVYAHILNLIDDLKVKKLFFREEDNKVRIIAEKLSEDGEYFLEATKEIGQIFYGLLDKYVDISAGDYIFVKFDMNGDPCFGMFKFPYKESYIHYVESSENGQQNKIIRQMTTLPGLKQKIGECFIINLNTLEVYLKEKKCEIDGEKRYYLSELVLEVEEGKSTYEKMKQCEQTMKSVVKKYCDDEQKAMQKFKSEMSRKAFEDEEIVFEEIVDAVFKEQHEIKEICKDEMDKKGLLKDKIEVSEPVQKTLTKKHKILIDEGIEIKLPVEYLDRQDKIEIINNPDGSLSFIIKNINKIK